MQKIKKVIVKKTKNKVLSRDTHLDKNMEFTALLHVLNLN